MLFVKLPIKFKKYCIVLTSALVAAFYDSLELPLDVRQPQALAVKLAELQYSGVELFYLVPGCLADNAVDGEAEYALKLFDRFARRRVEYGRWGRGLAEWRVVSRYSV